MNKAVKIDEQSTVESDEFVNEDSIKCAHFDLQIDSCEEYSDANKSTKCEDCYEFLCSPCVQYTEHYQKKQFSKHTKQRCLPCIKRKVADIKRYSNSGSIQNRDALQLGGNN